MSAPLKALYELQTIDLELAKLRKKRASLDDGEGMKQQTEDSRRHAEEADKLLHEATAEMTDKDLNLKSIETKKKTFHDKLYSGSVSNPKELDSMEKEIAMLGRQKDKLEERIIELLDIIEERKSALADAQAALKQREEEYADFMAKRAEADASLVSRIDELSAERTKAAQGVDAVSLKRYEALSPRAGGVVVSKVEGDMCSACHTQITGLKSRQAKNVTETITCENCGRMLYVEDE